MTYDYDVIVVGARVAGAATAHLLARRGHRVLLVDRVAMPADTVSTHAVLRTGVYQLQRWGILERLTASGTPAIRDVTLGFGDERMGFSVRHEHGVDILLAPRRHLLDGVLLDAATASGADFSPGTRVAGLRRDENGRVAGVEVRRGRRRAWIGARLVVGADGVNSKLAELVDAATHASHVPTNAIHYAYFSDVETDGVWFQFTPGVNAGLIPTNDGATCVFVGRPNRRAGAFRDDPDGEFRRLLEMAGHDLAERALAGRRVSPYRGTSGLVGFNKQPWGPGWLLVGDAGYTKDPISAHGISAALRDAELGARAIDAALRDRAEEEAHMKAFHRTRDRLSRVLFHESRMLARYEWDAAKASARMRNVSAAVRAECEALAVLGDWPEQAVLATGGRGPRPARSGYEEDAHAVAG